MRLIQIQDRFVNLENLTGGEFLTKKERELRKQLPFYGEKELSASLVLWWTNDNEMVFYGQEALWLKGLLSSEADFQWDAATMAMPDEKP